MIVGLVIICIISWMAVGNLIREGHIDRDAIIFPVLISGLVVVGLFVLRILGIV
tara:strand:- start:25018 stop:25179 length:162 start_codon:yes stop_codon:yes gene_type:complete